MGETAKSRNYSLDNLRILLITLVIAHHAGQAYGPTGGDWPIHNPEQAWWLGPFFGINAAFFMGLFFWIAGYFTPGAFDRKGAAGFLRDRFMRLGVPLVAYMLLAMVPITFVFHPEVREGLSFGGYYLRPWRWDWPSLFGHLWFVAHLLVYSLAYAAWRWWRGAGAARPGAAPARTPNGHRPLLGVVLALALVSMLVRFAFPQDRWVFVGIPLEPAHLTQYVLLFALGIAAARTGWFERVPPRVGRVWLGVGVGTAIISYAYTISRGAGLPPLIAGGGVDWRAGVYTLWEALACVGFSVGLLVLFRDRAAGSSPLSRLLAANTYGAYIVHILIVVGLQMTVVNSDLAPDLKFLYVTAAGWVVSFAAAEGLRRLPGARRVL